MRIIGLTGGSSLDRAEVIEGLGRNGVCVIEVDKMTKDAARPDSPTVRRVVEEFGEEFTNEDGTLNGKIILEKIMSDLELRKRFQSIVNESILEVVSNKIAELEELGKEILVVSNPTGSYKNYEEVIIINTPSFPFVDIDNQGKVYIIESSKDVNSVWIEVMNES